MALHARGSIDPVHQPAWASRGEGTVCAATGTSNGQQQGCLCVRARARVCTHQAAPSVCVCVVVVVVGDAESAFASECSHSGVGVPLPLQKLVRLKSEALHASWTLKATTIASTSLRHVSVPSNREKER